jgi:hypothetical protein
MSELILNAVPKKTQRCKNLCSTREQIVKLFIAILVNYAFFGVEGGRSTQKQVLW